MPGKPVAGKILGRPFVLGRATIKRERAIPLPVVKGTRGPLEVSRAVRYTLTLSARGVPAGAQGSGLDVFLAVPQGQKLDGKRYRVGPKGVMAMEGHIKERFARTPPIQAVSLSRFQSGKLTVEQLQKFTLLLEFGKSKGKQLPGRLSLSCGDRERSWASGTFTADLAK